MLVRVPIRGSGTLQDPFTCVLPTWTAIDVDYVNQRMTVDVPDLDAPDDVDAVGSLRRPILNGVPVLIGLTLAQRLRWRARLARRWQGIFDPSNVDTSG